MSNAQRRIAAIAVTAMLTLPHAQAQQPASTALLEPMPGQSASGAIDFVESENHLDGTLRLFHMPPGRPFSLHLADRGRCPTAGDEPSSAPAIVPDVAHLRADGSGDAIVMFRLDDLKLSPGAQSIGGLPVGIYASPGDGGALLACGRLGPKRQTFTTVSAMPGPAASLEDARACMDSEDRIVAFDRRRDADHVAVDASRTADDRLAALQTQAAHQAQLDACLKTHDLVCGKLRIGLRERATVLAERAAAASAAR